MPRLEMDLDGPAVRVSTRSMTENLTGNWRTMVPRLDAEHCTGCALCWKFCPDACIAVAGAKPVVDLEHCKGCGICAAECPPKCLTMVPEAAS